MNINKNDLVDYITNKIALPKKDVKNTINTVFSEIILNLSIGKSIQIRNFASFIVQDKNSAIGRNFITNEMIMLFNRKTIKCLVSQKFNTKIQD